MDCQKECWLDSIGAKSFPEPIKYTYTFPGYNGAFNLSERYIEETPLEELKAQYEANRKYVGEVISERKEQDNFRQDVEHF